MREASDHPICAIDQIERGVKLQPETITMRSLAVGVVVVPARTTRLPFQRQIAKTAERRYRAAGEHGRHPVSRRTIHDDHRLGIGIVGVPKRDAHMDDHNPANWVGQVLDILPT